jgi:glutamate-1-semialdehyde aminotransferase
MRPRGTGQICSPRTKALGLRWAVELIKRGILVNPNEKFYMSTTHTEADIDRALEAIDGASKLWRVSRDRTMGAVASSSWPGH